MKGFVEWKCLALILSEEIRDEMSLPHRNIKKGLPKIVLGQFSLEYQLPVSMPHFQH